MKKLYKNFLEKKYNELSDLANLQQTASEMEMIFVQMQNIKEKLDFLKNKK